MSVLSCCQRGASACQEVFPTILQSVRAGVQTSAAQSQRPRPQLQNSRLQAASGLNQSRDRNARTDTCRMLRSSSRPSSSPRASTYRRTCSQNLLRKTALLHGATERSFARSLLLLLLGAGGGLRQVRLQQRAQRARHGQRCGPPQAVVLPAGRHHGPQLRQPLKARLRDTHAPATAGTLAAPQRTSRRRDGKKKQLLTWECSSCHDALLPSASLPPAAWLACAAAWLTMVAVDGRLTVLPALGAVEPDAADADATPQLGADSAAVEADVDGASHGAGDGNGDEGVAVLHDPPAVAAAAGGTSAGGGGCAAARGAASCEELDAWWEGGSGACRLWEAGRRAAGPCSAGMVRLVEEGGSRMVLELVASSEALVTVGSRAGGAAGEASGGRFFICTCGSRGGGSASEVAWAATSPRAPRAPSRPAPSAPAPASHRRGDLPVGEPPPGHLARDHLPDQHAQAAAQGRRQGRGMVKAKVHCSTPSPKRGPPTSGVPQRRTRAHL